MSPWWRRPTSDGEQDNQDESIEPQSERSNESAQEEQQSQEPARASSLADSVEAPREEAPEPAPKSRPAPQQAASSEDSEDEEAKPVRSRSRSRGRRGRGSSEEEHRNVEEEETTSRSRSRSRGRRRPVRSEPVEAPEPPTTYEESEDHEETDLETLLKEVLMAAPDRNPQLSDERKIAMFCDFENIALGVRDSPIKTFDINLVIARLLEKGKIIVKRAYSDWDRYGEAKRTFHEAAIELIDIPQKRYSGKNSADIKLVVDAMDLCYSKEHLDTFVILSGDSDFSPLVSKLKENNKYVIGVGVKGSSSSLLIDNCDEFVYYEDMWRNAQAAPQLENLPKKEAEVFSLMTEAIVALVRENKDVLWGSMIKQTMQRRKPSFNEGYYGYSTFSELLEDAKDKGIIGLKKDKRSGSYIVTGFGEERRRRRG